MPLSEHEQRLLDQIEQALYAEDPKFASNVRSKRLGKPTRGRRLQGALLFIVGLALMPLGIMAVSTQVAGVPVLSILGFLMMFFGVLLAVTTVRGDKKHTDDAPDEDSSTGQQTGRSSFAQRMEERFRNRFDEE